MASMINCPYCGKLTDPQLDNCPHCGGMLQKSAPRAEASRGRGRQTCPSCRALVQEGDIICVACGTNLLTGQRIGTEVTPKKDRTPWVIGGVVAAGTIVVVAVLAIYVLTKNPLKQALALMEDRQYSEARNILDSHVRGNPEDERALYAQGRARWHGDLFAEAADAFERVVRLNPARTDAARWAVVCLASSRVPDAVGRQVEMLKRWVEADPGDAQAWYLLGLAYASQRNVAQQVAATEKAVALEPSNRWARWSLAIGLALESQYADAERELAAIEDVSDWSSALAAQGFIADMKGAPQQALEKLAESMQDQGLSVRWEVLMQTGKLLAEAGRFGEAEIYLREASASRRGNETARFLYGVCLEAQGSTQEARSEFEALANEKGPLAADAAVQAAHAHLLLGDDAGAQGAIEQAGTLGADNAAYYTVRGRVSVARGDNAGARDAFKRAFMKDPDYAPAYLEDGLLHIKREALGDGLRQLERYLELIGGPDSRDAQSFQIQTLIEQLRQTTGQGPALQRRADSGSGRVRS